MSSPIMLDIATAPFSNTEVWRQEQTSWEKIVKKISVTHRTAESYSAYMSYPKDKQDNIKDIGGFVGGYLIDGYRRKRTIKHRQILALDVDKAYPDLFEDFKMWHSSAAACYSTHKHSITACRLRIIMPLDRPVTPEEYEAITRKVAESVGMKYMDPTTFQPERMMYWPSTSKDGDFYFREQKGEFLSADAILSEYRDWHNVAEWPLCPTENEIVRTDIRKAGDPHQKEGVVGAFCRTYPISEAIETFLPEVYAHAYDDRYTYINGTTAGGAIAYEDKWLYSHHSTDPVSSHLVNAFDLVRIHKFGNEKESMGMMLNLARTDPKVVHELQIFELSPEITQGGDNDWLDQLEVDKKGNKLCTIDNFLLILRNDPTLKGKFAYNQFDNLIYVQDKKELREFKDADDSDLRHYFESEYGIYHTAKSRDAFDMSAKDNSYHPVRDYLNGLKWDGTPRLDTLFIEQLGVPDSEYSRAVTRKALVAAVARVMTPGIKFDYMVVAVGPQGKGKSSLLYDLGQNWFSDTLDSVTGKDAYLQIQGAWLLEMAELSSIKKAEVEAVKHFLTKREDRYRPPFGKHNISVKRQTVFFASTNEHAFLIDKTGNRRFWPLIVEKKYTPGSIDRDPIWAEAVHRYNEGETLFLTEDLEAMANEQQAQHSEADERAGLIQTFVEMLLPSEWEEWSHFQRKQYYGYGDFTSGVKPREKICAAEIWVEVFGNSFSDMTPYNTKYIHNILQNMPGWTRAGTLHYKKYGNQRSYKRAGVGEAVMADAEMEGWGV